MELTPALAAPGTVVATAVLRDGHPRWNDYGIDYSGPLAGEPLAFGNVLEQTSLLIDSRYLFTGRELDDETGLYYYRSRYYDPAIGRFVSVDPIGFKSLETNLFGYVSNAPTYLRDPFGQQRISDLPLLNNPKVIIEEQSDIEGKVKKKSLCVGVEEKIAL